MTPGFRYAALLVVACVTTSSCVALRTQPREDAAQTSSGRTPKESVIVALQQFAGSTNIQAKTSVSELKAFQHKTTGIERSVINDMLPLIEKRAKADSSLTRSEYEKVVEAMDLMAGAYPKDFELQLAMAVGIFNIEQALDAMAGQGSIAEGEQTSGASRRRAEALVLNFPNEARAHAQLAHVLAANGSDPIQAMRSYLRCREIDPTQHVCQTSFKSMADDYAKPRCSQVKADRFAVHPAFDTPRPGLKKISSQGHVLYIEKTPTLTGAHIADIYETTSSDESEASLPTQSLSIWLTPSAAARFASITEMLASEQAYMMVFIEGQAVSAPRVLSAIDSGPIQINDAAVKLSNLCSKFESRQLPEDLAKAREALAL